MITILSKDLLADPSSMIATEEYGHVHDNTDRKVAL